jgi:uncharacterized protein
MIWENRVLVPAFVAWSLAQIIKLPVEYLITHRWNWSIMFSTGGMPSSHSALVVGIMLSSGLYAGFDSPIFALAAAFAMIVTYDAAGVRRQAGIHAQRINTLIGELLQGHPISDKHLKEVLGHTPRQVLVGAAMGLACSLIFWFFWK